MAVQSVRSKCEGSGESVRLYDLHGFEQHLSLAQTAAKTPARRPLSCLGLAPLRPVLLWPSVAVKKSDPAFSHLSRAAAGNLIQDFRLPHLLYWKAKPSRRRKPENKSHNTKVRPLRMGVPEYVANCLRTGPKESSVKTCRHSEMRD